MLENNKVNSIISTCVLRSIHDFLVYIRSFFFLPFYVIYKKIFGEHLKQFVNTPW